MNKYQEAIVSHGPTPGTCPLRDSDYVNCPKCGHRFLPQIRVALPYTSKTTCPNCRVMFQTLPMQRETLEHETAPTSPDGESGEQAGRQGASA